MTCASIGNIWGRKGNIWGRKGNIWSGIYSLTGNNKLLYHVAMGKTLDVARDRAFDQTQTVLPAEVSRGSTSKTCRALRLSS